MMFCAPSLSSLFSVAYFTPPFAAVLRLFQFSSHWKIKMTSQDFKLSKIQIIIKDNGDDEEEEEQGPKEVPMFDQTMSILTMIKDQKVFETEIINSFYFLSVRFSILWNFQFFRLFNTSDFSIFSRTFSFFEFLIFPNFQYFRIFNFSEFLIFRTFNFFKFLSITNFQFFRDFFSRKKKGNKSKMRKFVKWP